jgi:hypothetical protein
MLAVVAATARHGTQAEAEHDDRRNQRRDNEEIDCRHWHLLFRRGGFEPDTIVALRDRRCNRYKYGPVPWRK